MPEDLKGIQIYSALWQVLLVVAMEVGIELDVKFSLDCEVGVSGPQSGKHLAIRLHGVLKHLGLYLTPTGDDALCPVLPYGGIKDGYQVPA